MEMEMEDLKEIPADEETASEEACVEEGITPLDESFSDAVPRDNAQAEDGGAPAAAASSVSDPVKAYLKEMGAVYLLTKEGEIELARMIEDGMYNITREFLRSPVIIDELNGLKSRLGE
ncbi:MAG: sigma-70 factor domain-containing protein, partial [Deltaproteobacteria bacterium]